MHIAEGMLPVAVCVAGYGTMAATTWYTLRKLNQQPDPRAGIPKASLLAAGFFVLSLISIPIPPASVHLILGGLMGILLGWYAFPAILVALFFQAVMFQHGGLTTLGVNATVIGAPALLAHLAFQAAKHLKVAAPGQRLGVGITGLLIGSMTLFIEVLLFYGVLLLSVRFQAAVNAALEQAALTTAVVAYLPLMLLEGLFTAMVLLFLLRVSPALLGMQPAAAAPTRATATERPAEHPAEQGEPV